MTDPEMKELKHQCAWCGSPILKNQEYYGFSAKSSPDIDLTGKAGQFVSLNLSIQDKTTFALVPDETMVVGLGGHDLLFITCSEDCASSLKEALDLERDVYSE